MSEPNDGGPAFPCVESSQDVASGATTVNQWTYPGLSVRDYFAAKALAGMFAMPDPPGAEPTSQFIGSRAEEARFLTRLN